MVKNQYIASLLYPEMLEAWKANDRVDVLARTVNDSYLAAMFATYLCSKGEITVLDQFLTALNTHDME